MQPRKAGDKTRWMGRVIPNTRTGQAPGNSGPLGYFDPDDTRESWALTGGPPSEEVANALECYRGLKASQLGRELLNLVRSENGAGMA